MGEITSGFLLGNSNISRHSLLCFLLD